MYKDIQIGVIKIEKEYPRVFKLLKDMIDQNPANRKSFSSLFLMIQNYENVIQKTIFSEIAFLEQESSTEVPREKYEDVMCEASFNKKCRMFREAIQKYMKAYQLVKNSDVLQNSSQQELLIKITLKIAQC